MSVQRAASPRRRGAAILEFAFVLPILVILLLGVWEVGRLIQVQQVLKNAAREGARLAAQGFIINRTGAPTEIQLASGNPNVRNTIENYLREAGIDTTGLEVTFTYVSGDTTNTEPYQAAKGQHFRVEVTLPFANNRWVLLGMSKVQTLKASVTWQSLIDDPFTLDTNLPSW